MSTLQIRLLGEFELSVGGQVLPPPATLKARSLLAFLVTHRAQACPREPLADLFWPEYPREKALHSLSTALWHIRRALPAGDFILSDAQEIRFNPGSDYWLDTEALETAIRGQLQSGRASPDPEVLAMAVGLYRGDFLEGFYDDWCLEERYHLEGLYLTALEWLIAHHQGLGQGQEALHYAELLLDRDPLREGAYRTAIRLHVQMGHRAEALRRARQCRAVLQAELGVDPEPETVALCDQLLGPAWQQAASPLPKAPRSQRGLLLERPLFVGRETEWQGLQALWEESRSGKGGLVLVRGEAGIGKSRLAEELARHVRQRGGGVLSGRCYEHEYSLPYGPLTDLLRMALSTSGRSILARLPPWQMDMLAYLLPELSGRPPSSLFSDEQQQVRVFEALTSFLLELAHYNPLLMILEDLHWASDSLLAWLHYLARHITSAPILVLATYRSEEVSPDHPLHRLAFALEREGLATHLQLGHLGREALAEWMVGASDTFITRVHQRTGGNPFFALETLRALAEAGMLQLVRGRWVEGEVVAPLPIPETVRQAISIHLGRLSSPARSLITVAAVIGQVLHLDVLQAVWGRDEESTLEALDELLRRRLLREAANPTAGDYEFDHHLIQEAIYADIPPRRRRHLHRQTAQVMARFYADRPEAAGEIGRHFDAAEEPEEALRYFSLAAQEAGRLFAWGEAGQYLGRVLELLDRLDPLFRSPEYRAWRGQTLADRAEMYYFQARLAERDADLAALTALAEATEDVHLRLQALAHRVRYLNLDARYQQAIAVAEECLSLASSLPHSAPLVELKARMLSQIGFAHYFLGQPRAALSALEAALEVGGEMAGPETRGRIAHILGYVHFHLGNHAQSLKCQREAHACHQEIGDYNRVAWDGLDIGALLLEMGELEEARQALTEHLALARRVGARPAEAYGLELMGCWELHWGDYAAAAERFREALALQDTLRSEHGRVAAEEGLGLALYHLGELAEARHWLRCSSERARTIGHRRRLIESLVGLGMVETALGVEATAREYLNEAVVIARESESREGLVAGLAALAGLERRWGDLSEARRLAEEAAALAREGGLPVCERWAEAEAGLAALGLAGVEAALSHTQRAVAMTTMVHEGWIGSERIYLAHARVLRALGRAAEAETLEAQALARVQEKASRIPDPDRRARYIASQSAQD